MTYIDLVLVQHLNSCDKTKYMFQAPKWSGIEKGDEVIVETCRGEAHAVVLNVVTMSPEYEPTTFEFIIESSGAHLPLKRVLKKIRYTEMQYEENTTIEENSDVIEELIGGKE